MTATYKQHMFIYNPGGGNVEFTPTYPATKRMPGEGGLTALRHDSITSSGIKQSVLERIDTLAPLSFPYCPDTDMDDWRSFMSFALGGGVFAFRPDASDGSVWYEYTLENMDWSPKWTSYKNFSVDLQVRLYDGSTVVSGS